MSKSFVERRRPDTPPLKSEGFAPSAFSAAEGSQQKAGAGLSILEKLPVPVLVHSGDTLHYANDEFFALTGYARSRSWPRPAASARCSPIPTRTSDCETTIAARPTGSCG